MSLESVHLRAGRARRSDQAGGGDESRVLRELAAYERPPVRGLLVSVPATSACPCEGRWSRRDALWQNERHQVSLGGGAERRSIITREEKGAVDK